MEDHQRAGVESSPKRSGHLMQVSRRAALGLAPVAVLTACGSVVPNPQSGTTQPLAEEFKTEPERTSMEERPTRFTIRPDDYHVPYAGTAEDGRKFFLSEELFSATSGWVGLFLWKPDGTFDEVRTDIVERAEGLPPGQAGPADSGDPLQTRLAELGNYSLEPITVEPFISIVDGTEFGWRLGHYDDGTVYINVEPGNFICYYAPWDGHEYDT